MILRAGFAALLVFTAALTPLRAGILEDRGIEDAINGSVVFRDVLIDRSMVQLYVRYGIVEMRGQVADERERDLLTYFVSALPDVKQVDNRLFVDSAERRGSERWRAVRLRSLLAMQGGIDISRTQIAFANGQWQLAGEVADDAARLDITQRLNALAPSAPLAVVLTVSRSQAAPGRPIDDASVAAMVRSTLDCTPALAIADAHVSCRLGRVVLRGSVRSEADRTRAIQLATASRGVVAIVNELSVRS